MIPFALAVFFMIVTPGPAVLALAGVGAAFSFKVGLKFLVGLTIGYLLVWTIVITGFASIIFSIPYMRTIFLIISSVYLIYLSLKIILRGSEIAFINPKRIPNLFDGIILQLINPKAYAFHSILLTGFVVFPDNFILETTWKFVVMNLIWIPLHIGWLILGSSIEKINLKPRIQKRINITMGSSLLIVALLSLISMTQL
jgi:threonine/homoserine/homoserine lactone efflux protein